MQQLLGRHAFQHTGIRPGAQRQLTMTRLKGHDDDMCVGPAGFDGARGIDPIDLGHLDIHQNQVGWIRRNHVEHLMTVLSLLDEDVPKCRHEKGLEALTDRMVVVGDDRIV